MSKRCLLTVALLLVCVAAQAQTPGQLMMRRAVEKLTHETVYAKDTGTVPPAMADDILTFCADTNRQFDGSGPAFRQVAQAWRQVLARWRLQGNARVQQRAAEAANDTVAEWDIGNWPMTAAILTMNTILLGDRR